MSFYGGLLGVIITTIIWTKKKRLDFWQWSDFIVLAVPAGYFFGRIGNFLNGELFGRITDSWWGMYFADGFLRHPSQLYEAFFEGGVIFIILQFLSRRVRRKGTLTAIYLGLYGFFRFWLEFLREPDPQLGLLFSVFTLGQLFSGILVLVAVGIYFYHTNKNEKEH
jgi:phosphatidylglycerol:prolipoprotein diacylglycerol transferase